MVKDTLPLSVVIPVYNEGEYIRSTIDSLKKNISFKNEIIVIYDQDQDTTVPVLEEICLHDASVKMLKNDVEPGPSGAIRTGISYSSGNNILVTMKVRSLIGPITAHLLTTAYSQQQMVEQEEVEQIPDEFLPVLAPLPEFDDLVLHEEEESE